MDLEVFRKNVSNLLSSRNALGIKVAFVGAVLALISLPLMIVSQTVGKLVLSVGILAGFFGVFLHLVLMFGDRDKI